MSKVLHIVIVVVFLISLNGSAQNISKLVIPDSLFQMDYDTLDRI